MLESTSHLLLLGPDKLHFTDSVFHREDGAPDRLEGRQQSMSKLFCSSIKNSCIFPGGGFCSLCILPNQICSSYTAELGNLAN